MEKSQNNKAADMVLPLATVNQLCEVNPALKVGGVRSIIFNEHKNGLAESGAIVRLGGKVLINVPKFFAWIESGQKPKPPKNPKFRKPRFRKQPSGPSQQIQQA